MHKLKAGTYTALAFGGLPLLLYPFVLISGVFWLASVSTISLSTPLIPLVVAASCVLGALAYPACFLFYAKKARSELRENNEKKSLQMSVIPIGYLLLLCLDIFIWFQIGSN